MYQCDTILELLHLSRSFNKNVCVFSKTTRFFHSNTGILTKFRLKIFLVFIVLKFRSRSWWKLQKMWFPEEILEFRTCNLSFSNLILKFSLKFCFFFWTWLADNRPLLIVKSRNISSKLFATSRSKKFQRTADLKELLELTTFDVQSLRASTVFFFESWNKMCCLLVK